MDVFDKEKRSWIMSRIGGKNTEPERLVRSIVHRMGFRFRLHRRDLPGNPDIVMPKYHKVIFVHGCFWHGHDGCPRSDRPTTHAAFWEKKLEGNVARDRRNLRNLRRGGWSVLVVWQCQTRNLEKLVSKIQKFLASNEKR